MKIKQVLEALESFAPLPLEESWDNAGLQIGLTEAEVSGVLLCLDVTEKVISEAVAKGCNLVVSHHPLLFHGLKQVADQNAVQRTVRLAIKNDVCVASMHTNLDNARGGVNFKIAEHLGLKSVRFGLEPPSSEQLLCGGLEKGQWVMGELPRPMAAADFIALVKERFGVACAHCNELLQRPVGKVAICGGAGDFLLDEVASHGADAFITGEMHYHQYFGHEQQLQICVIGHYESEQFTKELLRDIIGGTLNKQGSMADFPLLIAETNTNPIIYM